MSDNEAMLALYDLVFRAKLSAVDLCRIFGVDIDRTNNGGPREVIQLLVNDGDDVEWIGGFIQAVMLKQTPPQNPRTMYVTPILLLSEHVRGPADFQSGCSGGILLVFTHGELHNETVRDVAKRAVLAWLKTECASYPSSADFTWNDAAWEMPDSAWKSAGLALLHKVSVEDAAPLNGSVNA